MFMHPDDRAAGLSHTKKWPKVQVVNQPDPFAPKGENGHDSDKYVTVKEEDR